MKKQLVLSTVAAVGALSVLLSLPGRQASAQTVFQAAGPDSASIQGTVDAYRAALGNPNNGNTARSALADPTIGRREINWDGNPPTDVTTPPITPFNTFLNTRGAQFTTPGTGLSQAAPAGLAAATLFDNPTYATIFSAFSAPRLFTPVGSRVTEGVFFVPGTNGATPAAVTGFGAIFTDVDGPEAGKSEKHSTRIEYFDADGHRLFTGLVPASPGDGTFSFFGIVFDDPLIARVRITTGDSRPGPDDDKKDIVMMDDFIYGEPQPLP
jgi:hypothetical protein